MNRFPLWKNILVLAVLAVGFVACLTFSLTIPHPVGGSRGSVVVDQPVLDRALDALV